MSGTEPTQAEIVDAPLATTAVIRAVVPMSELAGFFDRSFGTLMGTIAQQGVTIVGPAFALYRSPPTDTADLEIGFATDRPVDAGGEVEASSLGGCRVARMIHAGAYDQLGESWGRLRAWIAGHGDLTPGPALWEVYVTQPSPDMDPADLRTELNWSLESWSRRGSGGLRRARRGRRPGQPIDVRRRDPEPLPLVAVVVPAVVRPQPAEPGRARRVAGVEQDVRPLVPEETGAHRGGRHRHPRRRVRPGDRPAGDADDGARGDGRGRVDHRIRGAEECSADIVRGPVMAPVRRARVDDPSGDRARRGVQHDPVEAPLDRWLHGDDRQHGDHVVGT